MECRDPKRIKGLLIDIEKRVEISPSRLLVQLAIQGLSMKHEATDALASWQFTAINYNGMDDIIDAINAGSNYQHPVTRQKARYKRLAFSFLRI